MDRSGFPSNDRIAKRITPIIGGNAIPAPFKNVATSGNSPPMSSGRTHRRTTLIKIRTVAFSRLFFGGKFSSEVICFISSWDKSTRQIVLRTTPIAIKSTSPAGMPIIIYCALEIAIPVAVL